MGKQDKFGLAPKFVARDPEGLSGRNDLNHRRQDLITKLKQAFDVCFSYKDVRSRERSDGLVRIRDALIKTLRVFE